MMIPFFFFFFSILLCLHVLGLHCLLTLFRLPPMFQGSLSHQTTKVAWVGTFTFRIHAYFSFFFLRYCVLCRISVYSEFIPIFLSFFPVVVSLQTLDRICCVRCKPVAKCFSHCEKLTLKRGVLLFFFLSR